MRKRSERQQDFEAIKQDLFTAGVATVKAAQAQKNMYMTSLKRYRKPTKAQALIC
jgi:hypothetical protein